MNTGHEIVRSDHQLLTTIAWKIGDEPVEYALEGAVFVTGAAVQWLRDGLGIIERAAETEDLAHSLAGQRRRLLRSGPGRSGRTALGPVRPRHAARPHPRHLEAHVARATLEAIGYQTRDVVEAMQQDSGIPLKTLRCDGGGSANGFLMQFQSDILGVPVEVPAVAETTALGAAYLAGLATGFWSSRAEINAKWRLARRYTPEMGEAERARLYRRWHRGGCPLAPAWATAVTRGAQPQGRQHRQARWPRFRRAGDRRRHQRRGFRGGLVGKGRKRRADRPRRLGRVHQRGIVQPRLGRDQVPRDLRCPPGPQALPQPKPADPQLPFHGRGDPLLYRRAQGLPPWPAEALGGRLRSTG